MKSIKTDPPQGIGERWKYLGSPWRIIRAYTYVAALCLVLFFAARAEAGDYLGSQEFSLWADFPFSPNAYFLLMQVGNFNIDVTTESSLTCTHNDCIGLEVSQIFYDKLGRVMFNMTQTQRKDGATPMRFVLPVTEQNLKDLQGGSMQCMAFVTIVSGTGATPYYHWNGPAKTLKGRISFSRDDFPVLQWDRDRRDPKLPKITDPKPKIPDPTVDPRGRMLDKATPPPPIKAPPPPPR